MTAARLGLYVIMTRELSDAPELNSSFAASLDDSFKTKTHRTVAKSIIDVLLRHNPTTKLLIEASQITADETSTWTTENEAGITQLIGEGAAKYSRVKILIIYRGAMLLECRTIQSQWHQSEMTNEYLA